MLRGQRIDIGILQNVKTFGIGLHQAVFDAVMNHLDEVSGADRAGVNIALLDARIAALAPLGARDIADSRRQRGKNRIQAVNYGLLPADPHAIAALESPPPPPAPPSRFT